MSVRTTFSAVTGSLMKFTRNRPFVLKCGEFIEGTRLFDVNEVEEFVNVVGDTNPLHSSGSNLIPGSFLISTIAALFATRIPECTYVKQEIQFVKPAFAPTSTVTRITINKIYYPKKFIFCDTNIYSALGDPIAMGTAVVKAPGLVERGEIIQPDL